MPTFPFPITLLALQILATASLQAQPITVDSLSRLGSLGGESDRIVYHRYLDRNDLSPAASAPVWRLLLVDGGDLFGDADEFPTELDALRIAVGLTGNPANAALTRSVAWAGIYSVDSAQRLLATARIVEDALLFEGMAGKGVVAPDNGSAAFELRLKFVDSATLGDQYLFSIDTGDAVVTRSGSSGLGSFPAVRSAVSGDLNRLVTTGRRLVVSSAFPDSAAPGVFFGGGIAIVDSADRVIIGSADSLRIVSRAEAGLLSATRARIDSSGIFRLDSLAYSMRNDSAVFAFFYPDADTLAIVMFFTGGAPTVPTIAHIRPNGALRREIDGTGIVLESRGLDGVFLVERMERLPSGSDPLPDAVNKLLARHFRIGSLTSGSSTAEFTVGLPIEGLQSGAHPESIRLLRRPDSSARWNDPPLSAARFDGERVYANFVALGEFALGTNTDIAVPVTGLVLSGESIEAGSARLRWRTKSEIGNAGFVIRRSFTENGPYVTVDSYRANAALEGAGTSPIGASYIWTDNDPRPGVGGVCWYMVVEVSFDGVESVHGPLAVAITPLVDSRTGIYPALFPNPFTQALTLRMPAGASGDVVLTLHDMAGARALRTVLRSQGAGAHDFEIAGDGLPVGMYLYRLEYDGQELTGTIVRGAR